ncbi:Response regulator PleD [Rubripirellula obstinata]|uniref:Translational regulator CsrA n=1 Tax=Rubripirellula obstinata TaxID=406547 RepID=A0A5B1CS29_9BACT|nr:response regulator [Rubripirellula obstinata]KAA1262470.1 Response regulator PleD [Rubripirellula obstinata]
MLVLSRQAQETIVFPSLGISVQVLRCSQNNVRIGIDAPREIAVLRGEIQDQEVSSGATRIAANLIAKSTLPNLRQTINEAAATLNQLHLLADAPSNPKCEAAIFKLFDDLRKLDSQVTCLSKPDLSEPQGDSQRAVRALLVDDNDNELRLLSSYLEVKGIEVTTANNGQVALQQMANCEPDIVLLDMSMPQFDGRWTIDQIRGDRQLENMPVFAVSGTDQADSDVEVGPQGVNGWFRKPLNPADLIHEITNSCASHQAVLN